MDKIKLLQKCQAGDTAAIETLLQTHQSSMFRLALLILDDPAEADEAVQDAVISAFRALDTFQANASLKTWLYAILVNECRNRWRKRYRSTRLKERLFALYRLFEGPASPEKDVIHHEDNQIVWKAIQRLGEKHRIPIILRYYQELPVAEIAQILRINEGTVHSRLNTARQRLHKELFPLKDDACE